VHLSRCGRGCLQPVTNRTNCAPTRGVQVRRSWFLHSAPLDADCLHHPISRTAQTPDGTARDKCRPHFLCLPLFLPQTDGYILKPIIFLQRATPLQTSFRAFSWVMGDGRLSSGSPLLELQFGPSVSSGPVSSRTSCTVRSQSIVCS
jgi:hypothetical protein